MFVISLKSKIAKRILLCSVCVLLVFGSVFVLRCGLGSNASLSESVDSQISDSSSVLNFISSLGWTVEETPDEIREVIIPLEFDDVYTKYNNIQISQDYDLKLYAGERVKKWTYTVKNYPGYEGEEFIKINILVFDGKVIGGDVCSVKLDGFMHGFKYVKEDYIEK